MELKEFILINVDPLSYYEKRFPNWTRKSRSNVTCVFHAEDTNPSLSIGLSGGGAKCHSSSCQKSIGNIVHFEAEAHEITEQQAAEQIYADFIRPIVDEDVVDKYHRTLIDDPKWLGWLVKDCGIKLPTVKAFKIGLEARTRRIIFPIRNRFGMCVNLRMYKLPRHRIGKDKDFKIINYVTDKGTPAEIRHGGIELFPWPNFINYDLSKPVFLLPSEKETILAIQEGLQAVCSTNGEGSWLEEWTQMFAAFNVGILMDPDKGGETAGAKLFATLQPVASFITRLNLEFPASHRADKDFDDWILYANGSGAKLLAKFQWATDNPTVANYHDESIPVPPLSERAGPVDTFISPKLPEQFSETVQELATVRQSTSMMNRLVKTKIIVAAQSQKSYDIPWKFRVKKKSSPESFFAMPMARELVSFVGMDDDAICKDVCGISGSNVRPIPVEYVTVSEVECIPFGDVTDEGRYIVQRCFAVGIDIEANVPYLATLIPTTLQKTQEKIGIIVGLEKLSKTIDTREFSKDELTALEQFRPLKGEGVWNCFCNVAKMISESYTNIYARNDWHQVALLTWFSPIGWKLPPANETYQRGWINSLAVGDTKTGKSEVVKTLQGIFRSGEIVNAENCTYVGLVGGAVKMASGQFMLRWGRIPLCDKQLVVLEELSGLSIDEISNLSDIRSSGIARLDKGGLVGRTVARTRLICLSNVRSRTKNLGDYLSGVRAVQELVGHAEDISRFDLIVTMVDSEVPSNIINQPKGKDGSGQHSGMDVAGTQFRNDLANLAGFAWALRPEQIDFSNAAYLACLAEAERLGGIYHPSIPIFKASADRYKIARIAASIATLQFSWTGDSILVTDEHVYAATKFLQLLYDKPSLGYREFSEQMLDRQTIKDEKVLDETIVAAIPQTRLPKVVDSLLHSSQFTRDDFTSIASVNISTADSVIGAMLRERAIRKGTANVWEITPAGKRWLQKYLDPYTTTIIKTNTKNGHTDPKTDTDADPKPRITSSFRRNSGASRSFDEA